MWKRQLRQSNVKSVENILRRNKNHKTCTKKAPAFFWFPFRDFIISNIFYKILNFNEWQLVSVIIHWTYTFLNHWALSKNTGQILLVTEEDTKKTRTKQSIKAVERKKSSFVALWQKFWLKCTFCGGYGGHGRIFLN